VSHTTELPTSVPEITIGTTLEWEKDFEDFPADEWTVTYYFRGAGPGFDVVGTADDTTHVFTVDAETTADLVAGRYDYQAIAVQDAEKHLVDEGTRVVNASLADLEAQDSYDPRSKNQQILDAIDSLMQGKAAVDQQKYLIATGVPGFSSQKEAERIDPIALLALRKYYAQLVASERRNKKTTAFGTIKVHLHSAR
jgi:hypothetical protein